MALRAFGVPASAFDPVRFCDACLAYLTRTHLGDLDPVLALRAWAGRDRHGARR